MNELTRWPELQAWLDSIDAKLMWTTQMNVSRLGPIQHDCWMVNATYMMIFYWPTSYNIYTSAPTLSEVNPIDDAKKRLRL